MLTNETLPDAVGDQVERGVGRPVIEGTQASKERPILFSEPMVRALLAGTKTQTRRVVHGAPDAWAPIGPEVYSPTVVDRNGDEQPGPDAYGSGNDDGSDWIRCPYGQPGDRLWVREAWRTEPALDPCPPREIAMVGAPVQYEAGPAADVLGGKLRPSIFLPRALARITLLVTGVRVERLNDISEADALAEGVTPKWEPGCSGRLMEAFNGFSFRPAASAYADLWEQINGPGSWSANPWVWVLAFRCGPNLQPNAECRRDQRLHDAGH